MKAQFFESTEVAAFSDAARAAVYDVISLRRDIRHFQPDRPVDPAVLARILSAANQAPSVGLSQPWQFILVRDHSRRARIQASFLRCRETEAVRFPPARREAYLGHKLEGILEAPLNICVVADLRDRGEVVLGTTAQPEALRASVCCAVQNLWLAARAEGIGVGWVSIVEPAILRTELALPSGIEPIAYLCVGHPIAFRSRPLLEETGWEEVRSVQSATHLEQWTGGVLPAVFQINTPAHSEAMPIPSDQACVQARFHQTKLVKPEGSLGRLEELAIWYAGARGIFPVAVPESLAVAVFAGDHGVCAEGVSGYGSNLTAAMLATVMTGGAAINTLAKRHSVDLQLIDVGTSGDTSALPRAAVVPLLQTRIRAGTRNLRTEAALTRAEVMAALAVGDKVATGLIDAGVGLVGVGEIGIGNTTAAAALACVFLAAEPAEIVGRGTGLDDAGLSRKIEVVQDALKLHHPDRRDPIATLAAVGGLELCAMAGFMLSAARKRVPVVLDGFVAGAAALAACALEPALQPFLVASHCSAEKGALAILKGLRLNPLLNLNLRLGEGTGAVLALDLIRTAVALQTSMATFATAGIWIDGATLRTPSFRRTPQPTTASDPHTVGSHPKSLPSAPRPAE